ncbi:MAG: ABC transporter ATP-binding protein [Deltaproteobacteria bacterium]|nr:ABC transporter ATP-binding protein [Deltaproteobacteria bacterium]
MDQSILEIKNLSTFFPFKGDRIYPADNVSLNLSRGKITALVGESGSGKTVTALSILRLIQRPGTIEGGEILFHTSDGGTVDILSLSKQQVTKIRGNKIAMIFQEPMSSLNPVLTVGDQMMEVLILHQRIDRRKAWQRAVEMLARVEISSPEARMGSYPHELSGGMCQRVMIAMGLSCQPDLLIADEPTTALDVTIQAQILTMIRQLVAESGLSVLLITHDLGIVAGYADQVAVMYAGQIVEAASTLDLFDRPRHPYTRGLLNSIPGAQQKSAKYLNPHKAENTTRADTMQKLMPKRVEKTFQGFKSIPGAVPDLSNLPAGCRFAARCERVVPQCTREAVRFACDQQHQYRCINPC